MSPILIQGRDFQVSSSSQLIIESGVTVLLKPLKGKSADIIVHGNIRAEGTEDSPVSIKAFSSDDTWGDLKFQADNANPSFLNHVKIEDGEHCILIQDQAAHVFANLEIKNCEYGVSITDSRNSDPNISEKKFLMAQSMTKLFQLIAEYCSDGALGFLQAQRVLSLMNQMKLDSSFRVKARECLLSNFIKGGFRWGRRTYTTSSDTFWSCISEITPSSEVIEDINLQQGSSSRFYNLSILNVVNAVLYEGIHTDALFLNSNFNAYSRVGLAIYEPEALKHFSFLGFQTSDDFQFYLMNLGKQAFDESQLGELYFGGIHKGYVLPAGYAQGKAFDSPISEPVSRDWNVSDIRLESTDGETLKWLTSGTSFVLKAKAISDSNRNSLLRRKIALVAKSSFYNVPVLIPLEETYPNSFEFISQELSVTVTGVQTVSNLQMKEIDLLEIQALDSELTELSVLFGKPPVTTVQILKHEVPFEESIAVNVLDAEGKLIDSATTESSVISFDLPGGIYFFKAKYKGVELKSEGVSAGQSTVIDIADAVTTAVILSKGMEMGAGFLLKVIDEATGNDTGISAYTGEDSTAEFALEQGQYRIVTNFQDGENLREVYSPVFDAPAGDVPVELFPPATGVMVRASESLAGAGYLVNAYSFSGLNLKLSSISDESSFAEFLLPAGEYRFLYTDPQGNEVWSETVSAGTSSAAWIDTLSNYFKVTLLEQGQTKGSDFRVNVYSEDGKYLGMKSNTDVNSSVFFPLEDGVYRFHFGDGINDWFTIPFSVPENMAAVIELTDGLFEVALSVNGHPVGAGYDLLLRNENNESMGVHRKTDNNGVVRFVLDDGKYKLSTLSNGMEYFSDVFSVPAQSHVQMNIEETHGQVTLSLKSGSLFLGAGVRVDAYHVDKTYAGVHSKTDAASNANFLLPVGDYIFHYSDGNRDWFSSSVAVSGTVSVEMDLKNCNLVNLTLTQNGKLMGAGYRVNIYSPDGNYSGINANTDDSSVAWFELPEGSYKLHYSDGVTSWYTDEFTVPGVTEHFLDIPSITDVSVVLKNGDQLLGEGYRINVYTQDGKYTGIKSHTDAQSKALFKLPSGDYKLHYGDGSQNYYTDVFSLPGNQSTFVIDLKEDGPLNVELLFGGLPMGEDLRINLYTEDKVYTGFKSVTDKNSRAYFDVPAGTYRFHYSDGTRSWFTESFTTPCGSSHILDLKHADLVNVTLLNHGVGIGAGYRVNVYTTERKYAGIKTTTDANSIAWFDLRKGQQYMLHYSDGATSWFTPVFTVGSHEPMNIELSQE
jgi:hypothetical protein